MKKFVLATLLSALVLALCYFLDRGFKIDEKTKIPGLVRLLNPAGGLWQNTDFDLGQSQQEIDLPGVKAPVKIYFDDRRVPHIFAENIEDALMAQGYIVAQDRIWQMDFMKRLASGRLSEVLGQATVKTDVMMRKYGLRYAAEIAVDKWKNFPQESELAQNYINGVNAYIAQMDPKKLPLEFKLANYFPENWDNLSGALISKYMAFTLCRGNRDIATTNARILKGETFFNQYFKEHDPKQVPVIRENVGIDFVANRDQPQDPHYFQEPLKGLDFLPAKEGVGSNNWAIAASHSETGHALLANDPHLQLGLPSIWYEIHIVTPKINAYGVTIPGIPGIIIGFNENIAYGSTNVGQDMLDYYTIDWVDEQKTKYKIDGLVKEVKSIPETIVVKKGKDIQFDYKITEFGPIMLESSDEKTPDLAGQWIAHKSPPLPEMAAFIKTLSCKDYDCYKNATNNFYAPAQNFIYADTGGNIGLRINGDVPIKYNQEGRFIKKGNKSENRWKDYLPREANPQSFNPSIGFVSSANQITTDSTYSNFYNGGFEDYRGRRINQLLESKSKFSVEDMKNFQQDVKSIRAEETVPLLLKQLKEEELSLDQIKIIEKLSKWDYQFKAELEAPSYFEIWVDSLETLVWDELKKEDIKVATPDFWVLLQLAEDNPNDPIFDLQSTETIEDLQSITAKAFHLMTANLQADDYSWGAYKPASINHLLNIPAYSSKNLALNGAGDVLNAVRGGHGPSWRMIVELGEEINAWGVFPGGQSGNPFSKSYDNMIEDWSKGNYYKLDFSRNEKHYQELSSTTQILKPRS